MEIVLATVLLMGTKDAPEPWLEVLRPSLISLAINDELIDHRERAFLFTKTHNDDLAMLRKHREGYKNYPRLIECDRWPERKLINDLLAMNRSYRNDLTARLAIDSIHEDVIRDAIGDTDRLYQVWDAVRDAQCDYYYVTVRRSALKLLRDLIGDEAFYNSQMPPNVPYWHFPRR